MSDELSALWAEIEKLQRQVAKLQRQEYIAGADVVDGFHAAASPAANVLLAMNADGKFPTHGVAGALSCETDFSQETNALYRIVRLGVGYKAGVADNTLTDILNITGPGGTSGSTYRGVILGTLDLVYTGRNTSGYTMACFYRSYLYAVQPSNTAISIALTQLTNNSYSTGAYTVTLTVQAKAGASATLGVIEAKATHTNYDAASNRWYWRFEGLAAAYSASNMLVPANAT